MQLSLEQQREQQCPHRKGMTCSLINSNLGWDHGCPLSDCDKCWSLGGPAPTGPSAEHRLILTAAYILAVKNNPGSANQDILTALKTHITEDEWKKVMTDPRTQDSAARADRWAKVKDTWAAASAFAKSQLSKGLTAKKVELTIKGTRHISCFGTTLNGVFVQPPCPSLHTSTDGTHHFCNECGCGDREMTWLDTDLDYSKLDYPYLECPRSNPGFSNGPSTPYPPKPEDYPVIFNAEPGGLGDMIVHLWHAEGYRSQGRRCYFYSNHGPHREVVEMFGHTMSPTPDRAIRLGGGAPHYHYELREDRGRNPRAVVWASQLPGHPPVLRPKAAIPQADLDWAANRRREICRSNQPLVLLFPFAEYATRMWPLQYWIDLSWELESKGNRVCLLVPAGRQEQFGKKKDDGIEWCVPHIHWGFSWSRVSAMMLQSALCITNDSGPGHLAGTLGVNTLALMGPTKNIFTHCGTVRSLYVDSSIVPCVGCHFRGPFRFSCDKGCQALMRLGPEAVLAAALDAIANPLTVP